MEAHSLFFLTKEKNTPLKKRRKQNCKEKVAYCWWGNEMVRSLWVRGVLEWKEGPDWPKGGGQAANEERVFFSFPSHGRKIRSKTRANELIRTYERQNEYGDMNLHTPSHVTVEKIMQMNVPFVWKRVLDKVGSGFTGFLLGFTRSYQC